MAWSIRQARALFSPKRYLIQLNLDLSFVEERCAVRYWHQINSLDRMIVVLEDKRYFQHHGIDWYSIARISTQSLIKRRRGGASTIEMQLIRTILNRREKTVKRKMNEFILAWLLNYRLDKLSILQSYTDIAFFGSHLNGASIAAENMFGKLIEQLSLEEAAFLAAMLVYPKPNVETDQWLRKVQRRATYGLSIYHRLEERKNQITQ